MRINSAIGIIWIMILVIGTTASCVKEGDVGPRGEQGVNGVDGEDGVSIYSGSTAPTANIGRVGDFYFQTSNSDFYGPKTSTGWGTPTNLRGAAGTPGAPGTPGLDGSRILSGTIVPATATGNNGDFYFRTTTGDFYGPKTASGWGTPINLMGVKGEDGSRIYSGATVPESGLGKDGDFYFRTATGDFYGPKAGVSWGTPTSLSSVGNQGPEGQPGSKILSGASTPAAAQGAVGDYYIHTTSANLYGPKTAGGWGSVTMNLRGPQGAPGSANVIYSGWIPPSCNSCISFNIAAPQLTQTIFDQGQIVVYSRTLDRTTTPFSYRIHALTNTFWVGPGENSIGYSAKVGMITMESTGSFFPGEVYYRYVLIPGGIQANLNVDFNDFSEIKAAFNIPN